MLQAGSKAIYTVRASKKSTELYGNGELSVEILQVDAGKKTASVRLQDGTVAHGVPLSRLTAKSEPNVTSFLNRLLAEKWKLQYQTSDGYYFYKSFHAQHTGVFTFRVVVHTVDNGGRATPGAFVKCELYTPKKLATTGLVGKDKPASEWKTLAGAMKGVQPAFTKAYAALRSQVGNMTESKS